MHNHHTTPNTYHTQQPLQPQQQSQTTIPPTTRIIDEHVIMTEDDLNRPSMDQAFRFIEGRESTEIHEMPTLTHSPTVSRLFALKRHLHNFLAKPHSSWPATIWAYFILGLILVAVVSMIIESIPQFYDMEFWWYIEAVISIFFTIEYLLRLFASSNGIRDVWKFIKSPMSIIDFLSFAPFYLEVILTVASNALQVQLNIPIFRIMRLFRAFRLVRITQVQILLLSIRKSFDMLISVILFICLNVLIASTFMYFAERGTYDPTRKIFVRKDGKPSPFQSILISAWWAVVSMTTTGYGDMIPETPIGKVVGGISILIGVLVIALPSMLIGRTFSELSSQYKLKKRRDLLLEQQQQQQQRQQPQQSQQQQVGPRQSDDGNSSSEEDEDTQEEFRDEFHSNRLFLLQRRNESEDHEDYHTDHTFLQPNSELIRSLKKQRKLLREQTKHMKTAIRQAEETQRMIHSLLTKLQS